MRRFDWRASVLLCLAACGRTPLPGADGGAGYGGGRYDGSLDEGGGAGGGRGPQLCREVDFLFVIDNSASMSTYQSNVVANYSVFIDGIEEAIETIETMHIGVVTAEPYLGNDKRCDQLGGLVIETDGPGSSNRRCGPYADGFSYMTRRDNLEVAFRCAAKVGAGGADLDTPLAAALSAISPPLTDPGACNEGFFNPGALLVLTIVTDSYPNAVGVFDLDPYFAGSGIVQLAGGYEDVVVVLIASTDDAPCQNPLMPGLEDFAGLFPHSYIGAICEKDYSDVFAPAVEVVKGACPQ